MTLRAGYEFFVSLWFFLLSIRTFKNFFLLDDSFGRQFPPSVIEGDKNIFKKINFNRFTILYIEPDGNLLEE